MDYDRLAVEYAAHRRADAAVLEALAAGLRPSARVLEVGCGSGSYVRALAAATGAECWGVDPSAEMLAAAGGGAAWLVLGSAEVLPFPDEGFDLVYSVDVIHHGANVAAALAEAFRVLRPGGRVCVGTEDEEQIRERLHARYFPETVEIELARYPPPPALRAALEDAGFVELREQRTETPYRVADSAPYRDRAFSSLHLIPEEALRRGLDRLERDLPVDAVWRQLLLWGAKP